jgi:ribosomal protein S1
MNVGDEVEAMIVNLDRKTRSITLSVQVPRIRRTRTT